MTRTMTRSKVRRTRRSTVQMLKSDIVNLNDYLSQIASPNRMIVDVEESTSEAIDCCDQLIHRLNRLRQDLTQLERGNITQEDLKGPLA